MKKRLIIFPGTLNPYLIKKRVKINLFAFFTPFTLFLFISKTPVSIYNRRFIPYPKILINISSVSQKNFKQPKIKQNFA